MLVLVTTAASPTVSTATVASRVRGGVAAANVAYDRLRSASSSMRSIKASPALRVTPKTRMSRARGRSR